MPNLLTSLQQQDLGHIQIVAELWGIDLGPKEIEAAIKELCASLLDPNLLAEILEALNSEAQAALEALTAKSGRIPWPEFTRRYGDIREVGPGKRDRDKPHLNPISAAEILFYRALIARSFFNTANGPQEFAYIPDDLLDLIKKKEHPEKNLEPLGRPALTREKGQITLSSDRILDDATTLLAALRLDIDPPKTSVPIHVLEGLLRAAKIMLKSGPQPEAVKEFLESPRHEALNFLTNAWLKSETFNELRMLPGLIFEGEWSNKPALTREFILNFIEAIPKGKWWSLSAFINGVKSKYPDFQRPSGDYDSWFIKQESDGEYLRGFDHWDQVDGRLIKYFVTGILFWLGKVDLTTPEENGKITAFRIVSSKKKEIQEDVKLVARSNGLITSTQLVPRVVRYQVARFSEWEDSKRDEYVYRLTPASLKRASEQGLKVDHLLSLLAKHTASDIPPVLVKALKRWDLQGIEARIQTQAVLRVSRPEVLDELRKSPAARFLGEMLGPTAAIIKPGARSKVLAALAELGLLAEDETPAQAAVPGGDNPAPKTAHRAKNKKQK